MRIRPLLLSGVLLAMALAVFAGAFLTIDGHAAPAQQESPLAAADVTATTPVTPPTTIDLIMYMSSRPQDDDSCAMAAVGGALVIDPAVTNPAMSCPDMFAWKLLIEAIQDEFWLNWAPDAYSFPSEPLPLCAADATDLSACCSVDSLVNPGYDDPENPGKHCPYFPADHLDAGGAPVMIPANFPAVAQDGHFEATVDYEGISEGRAIRQEVAEVVFRNEAMFDYIYENDIYHADGLAAVYARAGAAMADGAPAHTRDETGKLTRINFPVPAVMIKTNWLHEDRAAALGIVNDPDAPYITIEMQSPVVDNFGVTFEPGLHYLVAIHISSKDIPNWHWSTFEHVNNPGRCDMIGCSDAFGYATTDPIGAGQYDNFVTPKQRSDNLLLPAVIYERGAIYEAESIRPALAEIFATFDIGAGEPAADGMPTPADPAWFSYRLKGSQTTFTDSVGRNTLMGNSITEGGFVSNSSCMSCHARSAVNAEGKSPLAIFTSQLSEDGYPQSPSGIPDHELYYTTALGERFSTDPQVRYLQADFVWGFMFAQPLTEAGE